MSARASFLITIMRPLFLRIQRFDLMISEGVNYFAASCYFACQELVYPDFKYMSCLSILLKTAQVFCQNYGIRH